MPNAVIRIAAASPEDAAAHFEAQFTFETDCWDTHEAMRGGAPGSSCSMYEARHCSSRAIWPAR